RLFSGEFRSQCTTIARLAADAATDDSVLAELAEAFARPSRASNMTLTRLSGELRRRPRDRRILQVLIAAGLF
ncbi:MAG TPA: hypothetical protein H9830_09545, partial [Candidatus Agrococcus pullicola]|nr:hypothetical protein [Candidatus Agrococcus pullicola]